VQAVRTFARKLIEQGCSSVSQSKLAGAIFFSRYPLSLFINTKFFPRSFGWIFELIKSKAITYLSKRMVNQERNLAEITPPRSEMGSVSEAYVEVNMEDIGDHSVHVDFPETGTSPPAITSQFSFNIVLILF
jgi:hypothetical protein